MEDKIVQAAVVMILTPVYETEFSGFSSGFRPRRNQHDALDALAYDIKGRNIWWILDTDIQRIFDTIGYSWLASTTFTTFGSKLGAGATHRIHAHLHDHKGWLEVSTKAPEGSVDLLKALPKLQPNIDDEPVRQLDARFRQMNLAE